MFEEIKLRIRFKYVYSNILKYCVSMNQYICFAKITNIIARPPPLPTVKSLITYDITISCYIHTLTNNLQFVKIALIHAINVLQFLNITFLISKKNIFKILQIKIIFNKGYRKIFPGTSKDCAEYVTYFNNY